VLSYRVLVDRTSGGLAPPWGDLRVADRFTRSGAVVAATVGPPLVVKTGRAAIEAVDATLVHARGPRRRATLGLLTVQLPPPAAACSQR
jgi:ABC-type molybdate transport system permease subunit